MCKKNVVINFMTTIIIMIACISMVYMGVNDMDLSQDKHTEENEIKDSVEENKKNIINAYINKTCRCEYWCKEYADWRDYGYSQTPLRMYNANDLATKKGEYGEVVVTRHFYNSLREYYDEYIEAKKKNAPKIAFEENSKIEKTGIYDKKNIVSIGEEFCIPKYMTHINVNKILINNTVNGYCDEKGIVYKEFKEKSKDMLKNNWVYVVVNITMRCNSPWVIEMPIEPVMCCLADSKEVLIKNNETGLCICNDGLPVYFDKCVYSDEKLYYPMKSGTEITCNLGYFVKKENINDMYLVFDNKTSTYFSDYQNIVKIQ